MSSLLPRHIRIYFCHYKKSLTTNKWRLYRHIMNYFVNVKTKNIKEGIPAYSLVLTSSVAIASVLVKSVLTSSKVCSAIAAVSAVESSAIFAASKAAAASLAFSYLFTSVRVRGFVNKQNISSLNFHWH